MSYDNKIWWRCLLLVLKIHIRVYHWYHHAQAVWCNAYTSTKVRIFPWRFSTFLNFWCKIQCNKNKALLYPFLSVAVSTMRLLDVTLSTPKLLDVVVSTPDRLYSEGTVFCWLFTPPFESFFSRVTNNERNSHLQRKEFQCLWIPKI